MDDPAVLSSRQSSRQSHLTRVLVLAVFALGLGAFGWTVAVGQGDQPATSPAGKPTAKKPAAKKDTAKKETSPVSKKPGPAARTPVDIENPFPNRVKAPGLEGGKEWLNAGGPITMKDLRGKVVLIDFWTFCCINCIHVLPDLKYLEHKYGNQLVVIGCHSAKFDNEKESDNIRRAIMRYEIEHPVINDSNMTVWQKFGVRSWPTLVLIDPEGYYCGHVSGEGNRELLDTVVGKLIDYHRAKKTLDETPVRFDLEQAKVAPTPLRFPGKILADEAGQRLFISDSNHNRIVVATLAGKVLETIGNGAIGAQDGTYQQASFDHPQGMALVGDTLYVADTENHLIRTIDLAAKTVATLAGTGQQSRNRNEVGALRTVALNSPWDVLFVDGKLYIAMAGPHQIWVLDPATSTVQPYAGSGREDILNGTLAQSALAQPSGLATDGKFLYVVDSEGSSVRKVPLDPAGEVTTVVGTSDLPQGRCLFEFGDRDGLGDDVRLQHPLGIAYRDGQLFVADSYNHKIKQVDLKKKKATTLLGTGASGNQAEPPQFAEPAGLAILGDELFIADTNNHQIRVADLKTGVVKTLELEGLTPPTPPKSQDVAGASADAITVEPSKVKAGKSLRFQIALAFPEGYKLNTLAAATYRLAADGPQTLVAADELGQRQELAVDGEAATAEIPLAEMSGTGKFRLSVTYPYCREGAGGLCKLKSVEFVIPLEVGAEGAPEAVTLKVPAEAELADAEPDEPKE